MGSTDDLSNPLGQLGSVAKKTADQAVKEPAEALETVQEQAGVKPATSQQQPLDNKSGDTTPAGGTDLPSSKDTLEVVKKMYEASDSKIKAPSDQTIESVIKENPKKTPQEIQKMTATRQQLLRQQHTSSYFEPTFNRPRIKEEQKADEEKEKAEKEKKQMEALEHEQEEKKKEGALSVKKAQGTHEIDPGPGG